MNKIYNMQAYSLECKNNYIRINEYLLSNTDIMFLDSYLKWEYCICSNFLTSIPPGNFIIGNV